MTDIPSDPRDTPRCSTARYVVLALLMGSTAAIGFLMATFLLPGSGFAAMIGTGIFPAALLAAGFVWQQLWPLPWLERALTHWHDILDEDHSSPEQIAQHRRAIVMVPTCFLIGAAGGLVAALGAGGWRLAAAITAYALVGAAIGAVAFSLAEFELLPELRHGEA